MHNKKHESRHEPLAILKIICFVSALLYTGCVTAFAVPAVPNEAVAIGTVIECRTSPQGRSGEGPAPGLYQIVVKVEKVKDRDDLPNFLKGKTGQELTFWSFNRPDPGICGKKVKAVVEYRGDERGGRFWLKRLKIMQ